MNRAHDWLDQARHEFEFLDDLIGRGAYALSCFLSHQVAEKALKAVAFARGADTVKGHSLLQLCQALKINGELENAARSLDRYYISTRYPDAFPSGAPFLYFAKPDAESAVALANLVLTRAENELKSD
jgi:HEPN domain-containing protein